MEPVDWRGADGAPWCYVSTPTHPNRAFIQISVVQALQT